MQSLSKQKGQPLCTQLAAALEELSLPAMSQDGLTRPAGEEECASKVNAVDSMLDKEAFKLAQV